MTDLSLGEISGRFNILPLPLELPGNCVVCKAVNRPVLDFGVEIDSGNLDFWSGRLYMCVECILAAAKLIDRSETGQSYLPQLLEIKGRVDEYLANANRGLHILSSSIDNIFSGSYVSPSPDSKIPGNSTEVVAEPSDESTDGSDESIIGSDSDIISEGPPSLSIGVSDDTDSFLRTKS